MKKLFSLVSIYLLINFSLLGQNEKNDEPSLEETQQWIKEKIESFSYSSSEIRYDYTITFDEKRMIIKSPSWIKGMGNANERSTIEVADIIYISTREYDETIWLIIALKEGKKATTFFDNEWFEREDSKYILVLDKAFNESNLPARMKKAFERLVELYGGKTSSSDEPF